VAHASAMNVSITRPSMPVIGASPLISIVVNNFNYVKFLSHCIDSALAQRYQKVEVIVVDDASTDGSRLIIENYGIE
jgi:glycosyltransferase involved in cell wall biosynthesis